MINQWLTNGGHSWAPFSPPPSTLLLNLTSKSASECNENRESVSEKRKFKTQRRWKRESETDGKRFGGNGAAVRHLGPVAAVCYRSGICESVNSSQCTGSPHGEYTQTLLLWSAAVAECTGIHTHAKRIRCVSLCVCVRLCVWSMHSIDRAQDPVFMVMF